MSGSGTREYTDDSSGVEDAEVTDMDDREGTSSAPSVRAGTA